jgi:hypothetical protein
MSQSEKFQIEYDTYFYALAHDCGFHDIAQKIKNFFYINEKYSLQNIQLNPFHQKIIGDALQYYLLLRANEAYNRNEKKLTQELLTHVNLEKLAKQDKKLWKNLHFRNKFVPLPLIKLFRK